MIEEDPHVVAGGATRLAPASFATGDPSYVNSTRYLAQSATDQVSNYRSCLMPHSGMGESKNHARQSAQ